MKPCRFLRRAFFVALLLWAASLPVSAAPTGMPPASRADAMLTNYFRSQTENLEARCLAEVKSRQDWERLQPGYRRQLFEMLGLDPLPPKSDLQAVVTGKVERDEFTVENLHFQSLPGLYVTANLYRPKNVTRPAPTILYLSGHGPVISNGVSYGNKVAYQHHGAWFARNGYICLVLDTLQLGEIQGIHHGTYREGMWWWNSRGYTSAGVEAWNCIRALDYLATRPEVDAARFGATGRSGGGAYSWWIAALDDRIKAAAPVAGITDLRNHVVDGCVEGHCDCMYIVNTYQWDYPQVAALVAPRPLLLVNTDADTIFPLDGVQRTHAKVRRIYELHGASEKLGLVIAPGPHKDTQDLQVPVFRWFNRHLKGEDPVIEMAATRFFAPQELRVFPALPADAINPRIHESFVPAAAAPALPGSKAEWASHREQRIATLKQRVFAGWPAESTPLRDEHQFTASRHGLKLTAFEFDSDSGTRLRLYVLSGAASKRAPTLLMRALDDAGWRQDLAALSIGFASELKEEGVQPGTGEAAKNWEKWSALVNDGEVAIAFFAPRGAGLNSWTGDARKQTQIRRRFMLLGQTLDGMRVWDIRRATRAVRTMPLFAQSRLEWAARKDMAVTLLLAALFEPRIDQIVLTEPASSFGASRDYLNVLRVLDLPEAAALAAEHCKIVIETRDSKAWDLPLEIARRLDWGNDRLQFRPPAEIQGN